MKRFISILCLFTLISFSYGQTTIQKFRQYQQKHSKYEQESKSNRRTLPDENYLNADQLFDLGISYYVGEGVEQSYSKAFPLLKKAAEKGHKDAQFALATCYHFGQGTTKNANMALKWYRSAAEQGHDDAQFFMGYFYSEGIGVSKDYSKALSWFEKAANKGNEEAEKYVGLYYYGGLGCTKDYSKAVSWLKKAADKGNADAQCCLGDCYYFGEGVSQDYSKAVYWYEKAANKGLIEAKRNVELLKKAEVTLSVENNSEIYVDGNLMGRGQWSGLLLPFGSHSVECRKDKHRPTTQIIEVKKDGANQYTLASPIPICGTLVVGTNPAGAEIKCDGKLIGYSPLKDDNILIGNHKVEVAKKYFKTETFNVNIEEGLKAEKSLSLQSELPVRITSTPTSVSFSINGEKKRTPFSGNLPEGTYQLVVNRQYWDCGVMGKKEYVRLDSLNLLHNISLKKDNNYDCATFIGIDYNNGLQAIGLNFGTSTSKHFMFELNFYWGLKKSEKVYWTTLQVASLGSSDLKSFEYSHWASDLRLGPTFWCGPFLRISPELGVQYLKLRETDVGIKKSKESMVKGGYFSGIGSMRFRFALSQHMGLHITPEYKLLISNKKSLPSITEDVEKWVKGFGVKAGLSFYFF